MAKQKKQPAKKKPTSKKSTKTKATSKPAPVDQMVANTGNGSPKTGAVMVIGGGISGMQSALDLANSGFKVYVVEEGPSIGGRMSQLDKTFPTNDCSMCMISPKLIETGKHLNIEILTNSQVQAISGEEGNFKVDVLKKARYIDINKCTGCGSCAQTDYLGEDILHKINDQIWADRLRIDDEKCIQCGDCAVACIQENGDRVGMTSIAMQAQSIVENLPSPPSEGEKLMHEIARMSHKERIEYWNKQFSKCIKCYGCREVCPICFCEHCELEDPDWITPGQIPAEFPLFHLIRAYHVGENCIRCGACGETCPMDIPLSALMDLVRIDAEMVFDYVPGLNDETRQKLIDSVKKDPILKRKVRV